MKRSFERILQSAFNRYMFDFIQKYPGILTSEFEYNEFLRIVDYLIVSSILSFRRHISSIKDKQKTIISRLKRCNEI
jgi:hypothetical protein